MTGTVGKDSNKRKKTVMARKARTTPSTAASTVKETILDMMSKLWDKHQGEIESYRDESEDKAIKVNFGALVDYSKSDPNIKVTIRFSQAITDQATATIDDPSQGTFEMQIGKPTKDAEQQEA